MALSKKIKLPGRGVSGNYLRIVAYRWDRNTREASAHFALYRSKKHAKAKNAVPLVPLLAKLRLDGDKFDEYLSAPTLNESEKDTLSHLYSAAIVEPAISDFGDDVMHSAKQV